MSVARDPQLQKMARVARLLEELDLPALDYIASKLREVRDSKAKQPG